MSAIADIDLRLTACCEAFKDAINTGQVDVADEMYAAMDTLLDQRTHTKLEDGHVYPA